MTKITKANLPAIEVAFTTSGKSDQIVFDEDLPGFGLRLRSGSKRRVFVVQYEVDGVQRRLTIGTTNVLAPEQARSLARDMLAKARLGGDPQRDKAQARLKAKLTLRAVAERYLEQKQTEFRPKSMLEIKRYLMISWRPLHALPIHNIARADVATTMGDIVKRGRVSAGRARAALSSLFAWAIAQGLVEANPVIGTENPDPGVRRERVLSDAELVAIWSALPDKHDYGRIIKLLVLTAARREEVGGMCWTELHDDGTWTVPASRTKNGRAYTLTLPPLAWRIIEDVPRRASNDHLFGESSRGYRNWTEAKRALDKRCGVAEWTVHDLRRTAATGMATLGVQPHIIEAVLNHVSGHKGGIAGIYNRANTRARYAPRWRCGLTTSPASHNTLNGELFRSEKIPA